MRVRRMLALSCCLLVLAACGSTPERPGEPAQGDNAITRFGHAVAADYRAGYSADGLLALAPHVAAHAVLSNTNADRWFRDHWQQEIRSETGDDFFHKFVRAGDYAQNRWSVPLYSLSMLAGGYTGLEESDSPLAVWASRSLRANILGGPQGWALTYAIGSHRPYVGHSGWAPWNDNDGVSGHSIYGPIPFLTAARMSESPAWRYSLYAVSTLPALARVNENKHYLSQAYLGWAIAWVATDIVAGNADGEEDKVSWIVLPTPEGAVASLRIRF